MTTDEKCQYAVLLLFYVVLASVMATPVLILILILLK